MKVLLTGANGQLGSCFLARSKNWDVIATDYQELDITDLAAIRKLCTEQSPEAIVNAAAYTAVDKAEGEREIAYKINAEGPKNLATVAAELNIPFVHVSTDYVFNGEGTRPYLPNDEASPLGVYGETKWDGEEFVRTLCPKHVILRTAWVFSEFGGNFVKTMLRVGAQRDELGVVADQKGCPTYAGHLADAIVEVLPQMLDENFAHFGTHHYCGSKETTWHGFAVAIFEGALKKGMLEKMPKVNAIETKDYPTPAKRPAYSVMDCSSASFLKSSRDWEKALDQVLDLL